MRRSTDHCMLVAVTLAALILGCSSAPSRPRSETTFSLDEGNQPPDPAMVGWLAAHSIAGEVTLIQFGRVGDEADEPILDEMAALHGASAIDRLRYFRVELSEDVAAAKAHFEGKDLPFAVAYDADRSVRRMFGMDEQSGTVLVGKFARVRYRGPFPSDSLDEWAEALVTEAVDPGARVPMFGAGELEAGRLLVSTRLPSLDTPTGLLSKHFGPNGLVIVFIDTVCPYAEIAVDDLTSVGPTLAMFGVPLVAVNLDDPEDAVRDLFGDKGLTVPLLFDTTIGTKLRWGIDIVPTVVYVDAAGEIRYNGPALWGDVGVAVADSVAATGEIKFSTPGTGDG